MKLRIFYSWQTTTETKYNKNFIFNCIEKALKKLKQKPEFKGVEFILLEGVRGEPGSPQVAAKITDERIPTSDIFIADLSVVNQINRVSKWVQKILGDKFKPFQNNNVINEHGVASNAIGFDKIIGVLNNVYGSPNENPENILFDLRHIRFPIEYGYSKRTRNRDEVQATLIADLTSAIKDTALFALQSQKDRYNPLMVWSEWQRSLLNEQNFISNDKIEEIKTSILTNLNKESIRFLGLSGLGKTRILFEIFKPNAPEGDTILLSSRVLYVNCNLYPTADYQAIFTKLFAEQEDRIVILDNCSLLLHRQALSFIKRTDNKISLITLDSNPEEIEQDRISGVRYILIKKEDLSSVVDELLQRDFSNLGKENLDKIKEFSQGIPLMAVLLGDSVKNGEKFIGKLDDKELLDKLLGQKGQELRNRTILKACAIFNYFGFYDDLITQVEFIAKNKNITSLDGNDQVLVNDVNDVCTYYLKREIFERKGRFIGLRPFPLAISLAQEWLEPCTPQRLIDVIGDIARLEEPHRKNLSEALSEQMKYLGYNAKAVQIIEKIVGQDGPFDNAEVLNTELGSRLFRSFVEVNPVAISNNLDRIFSNKTTEYLLNIEEGRRNLIWVLEKLCFDRRTFEKSSKLLYSFGVAENETWANNATNQFLHLFNIILPGTEANLNERWNIIIWGLNRGDDKYYDLAIRAMQVGLNYGHFIRTSGAEHQGNKKLRDNEPSWLEVQEYWKNILSKLTEIIKLNNGYSKSASSIVADSIRGVCNAHQGKLLIPFLKDIIVYKNNDWDEGLNGLKHAKKYEKDLLDNELLNEINLMIGLLTKNDFATRYMTVGVNYHLDHDVNYSSDAMKDAVVSMADEFIETDISWLETFPIFYHKQQWYAYFFGKRIYELIKNDLSKVQEFIRLSLDIILSIPKEERNIAVLAGFLSESSTPVKENFYLELSDSNELNYLLFYFISNDKNGEIFFNLLFKLVDNKVCDVANFYAFEYSEVFKGLSIDKLSEFSNKLFKYGDEGYRIVFGLLFTLGYNNKELEQFLVPLFKECIYKLGFNKIGNRQLDGYKWSNIICLILDNYSENDFAKFINKSIIDSISWENTFNIDTQVKNIYRALMKNHFSAVWPELSDALLGKEEQYINFYGLKNILGSHIGGMGDNIGVLFDGNIEEIFEWCNQQIPLAPTRLAELTPIFDNNNYNNPQWHPVALRLIDDFGDYEQVLSHLSSNMGSFSWTGSVVPFLTAKKELFSLLVNHKKEAVRNWASTYINYLDKDIEQEKNRDAEWNL